MSTIAHFIYEDGINGYEETAEPVTIFGKFIGWNAYLILEPNVLKSFSLEGEYIKIKTKNTAYLPTEFKVWGDAILDFDWDEDGLCLHLKGGHHITKKIVEKDYLSLIV